MALAAKVQSLISELSSETVKLGDIKKHGKTIKKDHNLATELWSSGNYNARLLAILIFDKKLVNQVVIESFASDIVSHNTEERNQLCDWFLANQLMKDKKLIAQITTWQKHSSPLLRRLFWYHQARLRWTGQPPPPNSAELLDSLELDMGNADPEEQWAMNFCAGQIGIHQPELRSRCINLGKNLGLYKNEPVAKNCTPLYLPEFIRIEVAKREK